MSRAALLAAIAADPDEDTPRLAYADLLEEEGEPGRAEFVRAHVRSAALAVWDAPKGPKKTDSSFDFYTVSCPGRWVPQLNPGDFLRFESEGARFGRPITAVRHGGVGEKTEVEFGLPVVLPPGTVDPWQRGEMRDRAASLWRANYAKWFGDVDRLTISKLTPLWIDECITRGFVESITTTCALWLAHGPAVVRAYPTVREVRLDIQLLGPQEHGPLIGTYFYSRRDVGEQLWGHIEHDRKGVAAVFVWYWGREKAIAALSAAALSWARAEPLPAPE